MKTLELKKLGSVILRADPADYEREPSPQCSDMRELACGNGIVVQVGPGGDILTSKAGRIRAERLDVRTFVRSVTFGQGLFVAVGGSHIDVRGAILFPAQESMKRPAFGRFRDVG